MIEGRIRKIAADILDLDPALINGATSMENTQSWDSLAHISLMTALEQHFGVTFEIDEIESMRTFSLINQVLERKLNA